MYYYLITNPDTDVLTLSIEYRSFSIEYRYN